jgi:hypothetical protein
MKCHKVYRASPKKVTGWFDLGLECNAGCIVASSRRNVNTHFTNIAAFLERYPDNLAGEFCATQYNV